MKLIFFGGVQGTGKTTLITWLKKQFKDQIVLLDPGKLFRRYLYENKVKTAEEIENLIIDKLEEAPDDAVVVIHWHYAVRRPAGFIPQVRRSRIKRLVESGKVKQAVLLMVKSPASDILKRRLLERGTKKRALSLCSIREEIARDEEFFAKQYLVLARVLGRKKVAVFKLTNKDLDVAKKNLENFFKRFLPNPSGLK